MSEMPFEKWELRTDGFGRGVKFFSILGPGEAWVCSLSIKQEVAEEVAQLLVTAPDLFSALNLLLATLSVTDEEGLVEFAEPVIKARAAIAKAMATP